MIARADDWLSAALSTRARLLVVAGIVVGLLGAVLLGPATGDAAQLEPVARAVVSRDLADAYDQPSATSPPGYPVLVAAPLAAVEAVCSCDAYGWIGFATLPLLGLGAAVFARRTRVAMWTGSSAVVALGTLFAPGVLHSLTELYHPQDLAALAFVLFGAAGALDRHHQTWRVASRTGAALGMALCTRQWALLPLVVIAAYPSNRRVPFVAGAVGVVALVCGPFLVADADHFLAAIQARDVIRSMTIIGRTLPAEVIHLLARAGPLVLAAGLAWVFWRGWRRRSPDRDGRGLAAAIVAVLLARLVFEPVLYQYYLAPAAVVGVIWASTSARGLALVLACTALTANFRAFAIGDGAVTIASAVALEATLVAALAAAARSAVQEQPTVAPSSL